MVFYSVNLCAKSSIKVDSIRIVGIQYDGLTEFRSRYSFLKEIMEMKRIYKEISNELGGKSLTYSDTVTLASVAYVDSLITSRDDINSIIYKIRNLKKVEKLTINTKQSLAEAYYSHSQSKMYWSAPLSLHNQLLMILFQKDKVDFVWLNTSNIDYGNYRYEISKELMKVLSHYTHIYDSNLSSNSDIKP